MSAATPYRIEANSQNVQGLDETFCVRCQIKPSGSQAEISFDNDNIQVKGLPWCQNELVSKDLKTYITPYVGANHHKNYNL